MTSSRWIVGGGVAGAKEGTLAPLKPKLSPLLSRSSKGRVSCGGDDFLARGENGRVCNISLVVGNLASRGPFPLLNKFTAFEDIRRWIGLPKILFLDALPGTHYYLSFLSRESS